MNIAELDKLKKYGAHIAGAFHANCRIIDLLNRQFLLGVFGEAFYLCDCCKNKACNLISTYSYGCREAYRWNGKYIFYCPSGFAFVAASISDAKGGLTGGMVVGPIIMGELDDTLQIFSGDENADSLGNVENRTTKEVNDISEILSVTAEAISGVSHSLSGKVSFCQQDLLQALFENQRQHEDEKQDFSYPLEKEKQLQRAIRDGDKVAAHILLNDFLGRIFLITNFNLETSKIRIIELLTVLSRSTIEAGADSDEIIWLNTSYAKELQKCTTIDELSVWITDIMYRFMDYAFEFSAIKHSDTVFKVDEYIKRNYASKIALDDIATHVNFSKTYLSRIFKEETGENISNYINKIRIEKAKLLLADKRTSLADVANCVGFEDQSYFTKVFKAVTGVPPKKFKETRTGF